MGGRVVFQLGKADYGRWSCNLGVERRCKLGVGSGRADECAELVCPAPGRGRRVEGYTWASGLAWRGCGVGSTLAKCLDEAWDSDAHDRLIRSFHTLFENTGVRAFVLVLLVLNVIP